MERVGIIGIGYEGFRPVVADLSTREMMYAAATKAYDDGEIDARKDIGSFICCTEDLWEGWSISDEMVPDQIGGAKRSVCTIPSDGVTGLGHAVMQILAGVADVVALEAHSKVGDVLDKDAVERMALEPTYIRPLGINNDLLAGLEMSAFLARSGFTREDCNEVVIRSKKRAIANPRASYGAKLTRSEIERSEVLAPPLMRLDKASFAEAAIVIVLASERWIRRNRKDAIYIDGIAWRSATPWLEGGGIERAKYAYHSFQKASELAGLRPDLSLYDVIELDDTYSYKLLQHLHPLLKKKREVRRMIDEDSSLNPSGGSLGVGNLIEATALHKMVECILQLRGVAGKLQIKDAKRALVLSWRGHPTATGGVAILSR